MAFALSPPGDAQDRAIQDSILNQIASQGLVTRGRLERVLSGFTPETRAAGIARFESAQAAAGAAASVGVADASRARRLQALQAAVGSGTALFGAVSQAGIGAGRLALAADAGGRNLMAEFGATAGRLAAMRERQRTEVKPVAAPMLEAGPSQGTLAPMQPSQPEPFLAPPGVPTPPSDQLQELGAFDQQRSATPGLDGFQRVRPTGTGVFAKTRPF